MMWMHTIEARAEIWRNVSDAAVMWFKKSAPNEASEVAVRALRQGILRTFQTTHTGSIERLRALAHHAPWVPVVAQAGDGWAQYVNLELVTDVRLVPAPPGSDFGEQIVLTLTYDPRDTPTHPTTETLGLVVDPVVMEHILERVTRGARM